VPRVTGPPLALASSLTGGVSDFLGGTNSRVIGPVRWMFCTQLIGLVLAGGWVAVSGDALPGIATIAAAVGASLGLVIGLLAFFQAMVVGTISIVAPISATGVVIPIAVGVARGEHPAALQVVGIVAACIGIAFASRVPGEQAAVRNTTGLWLALLAALGGGFFFWLMEPASRHGVPWAVLISRAIPVLVLGALLCARRDSPRSQLPPGTARAMLVSAAFALAAIALYAYATVHGQLAIVSVLGSLYPVVTVLLAYRVLGERLHRVQGFGIASVLVGVLLMSAG
jgi:drug/metabolite transporter (DMT)-like permease